MFSGDCQSQGLAEWLQTLGCPVPLTPSDIRALNTPKMRSVWRHLQAHVMPAHSADTVRQNVLLARLVNEKVLEGQFGSFQIDSVDQLNKAKVIIKLEEELHKIKDVIKTVDKKLDSEKSTFLHRTAKLKFENQRLKDIENKTTILKVRHSKILRECEHLNTFKETALYLKSPKTPISYNEMNSQKSLVSKYVRSYRFSPTETEDDGDELSEIMGSFLEFKPDIILDCITQNAKEALRTFNSKVCIDMSSNLIKKLNSNNVSTFREHLRSLKVDIIRNELKILECLEKISVELRDFEEEKAVFIKLIPQNSKEMLSDLEISMDSVIEKSKNSKMQLMKNMLMPDDQCKNLEEVKWSVSYLIEKENDLWKEVEKKVIDVNKVASLIFNSVVESEKINELLAQISQLASDFQTESKQMYKKNNISCEFADMVTKEIEIFQKMPLLPFQREWITSNEVQRVGSSNIVSDNCTLLHYLLQYEDKDLIANVLEKYCWSLSVNPQFH